LEFRFREPGQWSIGLQVMRPGLGYGYNGAVEFDPAAANLPGGAGTFYRDGAAGTWFWVDPVNDIVFVGMVQRMLGPDSPLIEFTSRSAVYGALVDPAKQGSHFRWINHSGNALG
jgi:CubicO group peptidase (beta-lactamase class C family)